MPEEVIRSVNWQLCIAKLNSVQCPGTAARHTGVQCSVMKCSEVQCSAVRYNILHCSALHCILLKCSAGHVWCPAEVKCSEVPPLDCTSIHFNVVQCSGSIGLYCSHSAVRSRPGEINSLLQLLQPLRSYLKTPATLDHSSKVSEYQVFNNH